jgi:hypothetical protein
MRTILVCGSAPCVHKDVDAALLIRPDAELFLVNGAATLFENAQHVLAGHASKAELFQAARKAKFPNAPPWLLHAECNPLKLRTHRQMFPSVDRWHSGELGPRTSSVGTAAKIALAADYHVILCGSPLDGSGYHAQEARVTHDPSCVRLGLPEAQSIRMVQSYRDGLKALAESTFKNRVWAMSGYSAQVLGYPPHISITEDSPVKTCGFMEAVFRR